MLTFTRNRNGSTWEANCDGCPEGADLDTGSFERAKGHLKARGWVRWAVARAKPSCTRSTTCASSRCLPSGRWSRPLFIAIETRGFDVECQAQSAGNEGREEQDDRSAIPRFMEG